MGATKKAHLTSDLSKRNPIVLSYVLNALKVAIRTTLSPNFSLRLFHLVFFVAPKFHDGVILNSPEFHEFLFRRVLESGSESFLRQADRREGVGCPAAAEENPGEEVFEQQERHQSRRLRRQRQGRRANPGPRKQGEQRRRVGNRRRRVDDR